jgi:hypothetical protein
LPAKTNDISCSTQNPTILLKPMTDFTAGGSKADQFLNPISPPLPPYLNNVLLKDMRRHE